MPERDLEGRLAAIADHGARTGRLAPAATVRARGDRRRRRRHAATGALGVTLLGALGVAIALGQPRGHARPEQPGLPATASTSATTAPATPSTSKGTPPSSRPSGPAVLSGDRQVHFYVLDKGTEVPESLVDVLPDGRVGIGSDFGDRGLFVPRPTTSSGDVYQILTAKLRTGGQPLCLAVQANGSKPLTVVTAACDTGASDQLFVLHEQGKDNQGRTMYGIENQAAFLQYDPDGNSGLIAEELGDAPLDSTWVLIDNGPATLPDLD
ncbi:MAG: hypothetical protein ACJ786_23120 [Catenulispora sp.]